MIPAAMRIRFCREEDWGGTGEEGVGGCIRIRRLNDTMVYGAKQVPGLQAFYVYQEALLIARLAVWPVWCILQVNKGSTGAWKIGFRPGGRMIAGEDEGFFQEEVRHGDSHR